MLQYFQFKICSWLCVHVRGGELLWKPCLSSLCTLEVLLKLQVTFTYSNSTSLVNADYYHYYYYFNNIHLFHWWSLFLLGGSNVIGQFKTLTEGWVVWFVMLSHCLYCFSTFLTLKIAQIIKFALCTYSLKKKKVLKQLKMRRFQHTSNSGTPSSSQSLSSFVSRAWWENTGTVIWQLQEFH